VRRGSSIAHASRRWAEVATQIDFIGRDVAALHAQGFDLSAPR
jgi:hypothetical protein